MIIIHYSTNKFCSSK